MNPMTLSIDLEKVNERSEAMKNAIDNYAIALKELGDEVKRFNDFFSTKGFEASFGNEPQSHESSESTNIQ